MTAPVFAVVGHPNKGKSSIVATLTQNDAIAIALEPGTTREQQAYPLKVDGEVLYTLVDTPGFQRPRRLLQWLEAHSLSASDRADTVAAFIAQHRDDPRFHDECELLAPVVAGAGIIYVVDGSVPYGPEHEAEMAILRWSGRPSLALINSIGPDDHSESWQAALGQFFQAVRRFDAVRAPFEHHLGLLRAFGQLEPAWEAPLEKATHHLQQQREQQQQQAARLIAAALEDMMSWQESRTIGRSQAQAMSREQLSDDLKQRWYQHQRERELELRRAVERLYQHHRVRRQEAELSWHRDHDLFSDSSRQRWGVDRRYLAGAGFGAGAIGGAGLDALTLGGSLGTGALIGGVIGATGSYFYGSRLSLPGLDFGPWRGGLQQLLFGPVQDAQFGYIVLGRAVDHWWHISQRNHAGRDLLDLPPGQTHWLEQLPKSDRHVLHKSLERCRRGRPLEPAQRDRLSDVIHRALGVYHQWRTETP